MKEPNHSEQAILSAALKLHGAERAVYLDQACGGDAALRERVRARLQAQEQAGSPSDEASATGPAPTIALSIPLGLRPEDRIGRYKLLEQIGEGGCGVVYLAEQQEPIRRRVALKVIKLGMDTKQVVARFEAERQALALMDHPNIAKALDAGTTENGRPFFVMELVRGVRITDYCDKKNLSTFERLSLFIQVCHAVQHAHEKGIIHRDIKPSNILVTVYDGLPTPKVIDFGIAKATAGQTLTDKTLYTAFEQFIGTPTYMSPEQAEMTALDIDARSDIYSLGVLLYELLTGNTPFDPKRLIEAGMDGIRRIIRSEEPPRPSTKLSTLAAAEQTTVAKRRRSEPPKLINLIRGDLDWVVMKCLEKDPSRRYRTANLLAEDLDRYLSRMPVSAAAPTIFHRLSKLFRRHGRTLAQAGAGFLAALLLLSGLSIWRDRSRLQGAKSESKKLIDHKQAVQSWTVKITKATQATVEVDLFGVNFTDKAYWLNSVRMDDYWRPQSPLRQSAIERYGAKSTRFDSANPFVLDSRDPAWENWHGCSELAIMADLPGTFPNPAADPRRLFLPLGKNDWAAQSRMLEIEVLEGQVRVLTAVGAATRTAAEFQQVMAAARGYEEAGNFTNALERYQAAQQLKPDDAEVTNKVEAVKPKAAAQVILAAERAKQERQTAQDFQKVVDSAKAAEWDGNFTNALAFYQQAQKLKQDDAQVGAKIQELTPKAAAQASLAAERAKQERQTAEDFQKAVDSAKAAERDGNFTNALAFYQQAQKLKQDDARVRTKIQELTPKAAAQANLAAERAKQERQTAEDFQKAVDSAKAAERDGNFTNALAFYQQAQKLKQDDAQVGTKLQELTPKAAEQLRAQAKKAQEAQGGGSAVVDNFNRDFASLAKELNVTLPKKLQHPGASNATRYPSEIMPDETKDLYRQKVTDLENRCKQLGLLSKERQDCFSKMRYNIKGW